MVLTVASIRYYGFTAEMNGIADVLATLRAYTDLLKHKHYLPKGKISH